MASPLTIIIIVLTSAVSLWAFSDRSLFSKLQFNPYQVFHRKEYYRLLTHGFIHVDMTHLFVNMLVLFFFGRTAELQLAYKAYEGIIKYPNLLFILLYLTSIVFASSITLFKHKDNYLYNSVGASGAVAAVMFFCIFFEPWMKLYLYFAIPIPGIVFAILYVIYSQYMGRRQRDNINHEAHLLGAVFGFIFPLFIDLDLFNDFIQNLLKFNV